MNFMDTTVKSGELVLADTPSLPAPQDASLRDGQSVRVGIRPEASFGSETGLHARIKLVELTSADIHVGAVVGETDITVVLRERHALHPIGR